MSNFKREEEKYLVVKASDLLGAGIAKRAAFFGALHGLTLPARKFLVIESNWPEYQIAWNMIQARVEGKKPSTDVKRYHLADNALVEGEALGRITVVLGADHDRITAERDALQKRVTAADEALRKDAERYRWLRATEDWDDYGTLSVWITQGRDVENSTGEHLDSAIDQAMSKGEGV